MSKAPALRLDRLLANLGYGSRRELQIMARNGRIRLDGEVVRDIDERVPLTSEYAARLTFDGDPIDPLPGVVLMLNKPLGVTCSHKDAGPLVYRLLPERWQRREPKISAVGRLDKETSGLLLMTDDGAFLHQIISPRRHIPKRYLATLDRPLRGDEAEIFASGGLMLDGEEKPLLPAMLETISPCEAAVTVTEGRYHQVRRMFAAVKNHVTALHRVSIGGLTLPEDLEPGRYVVLDAAQRAAIMSGAPDAGAPTRSPAEER
jgi:16S rRNA pseudouridine516 synthase